MRKHSTPALITWGRAEELSFGHQLQQEKPEGLNGRVWHKSDLYPTIPLLISRSAESGTFEDFRSAGLDC